MRFVAALLLSYGPALAQTVSPFTVTEISRRFDERGKLISEHRFRFAVNRNGAIVSADLDPEAAGVRQIRDAARGRDVLIDPKLRTATLSYTASRAVSPSSCVERFLTISGAAVSVEKSAGTIHAVPVERVTIEQSQRGLDLYLAPSLGCHALRSIVRRDGQILETQATQDLEIGDPDPALFEIPHGYRINTIP